MAIEFRDLQRDSQLAQKERDEQFKRRTALIPVVLTDVEGSTTDGNGDPVNAQVIGKINYVWARAYNEGIPAQYLNVRGVLPIGGTPCWAGYDEASTEREILRVNELDPSATLQQPQNDHHRDHEPGGYQLVNVYLRAIVPLKLSPKSGLTVTVAPFTYPKTDGTFEVFPGNNSYDLSGSVPGAGLARYTLVYLDPSTNTLAVTDGATTIDTVSIVPDFPDPTSGTYPSAWVRLANGQTTINEVQDIEDARILFLPFSPSVLGGNIWAKAGKIMWEGTEYASINAACTAATAGEIILGPGTAYTWDASTLPASGVKITGAGRGLTTVTVTADTTVTLSGTSTIQNLRLQRTVAASGNRTLLAAGNVEIKDCDIYDIDSGSYTVTAVAPTATGFLLDNCIVYADSSGTSYGMAVNSAIIVGVRGGQIRGGTNSLYSASACIVSLFNNPSLVNAVSVASGTVVGSYDLDDGSYNVSLKNYNLANITEETSPAGGDWILTERASDGDVRRVAYDRVKTINPNLLINGAADIWQRGTSFDSTTTPLNSDDTYLMDNWLLVSNGADSVDVSQQTASPPAGARYFVRSTVQTINQQFGYVLFMEASDAIPLRGQTVSLSLQAKTTAAAIATIRAGILEWTSTADSITSDVVGTWAGAGTNPTLATNWAFANTPANLALTTSWQTFKDEAVTLGSTFNNLAVFVWVDDTTIAINDILDLATVKLERGSVATAYEPVGQSRIVNELASCQRYCYDTRDASKNNHGATAAATNYMMCSIDYPVPMRVEPTKTIYNGTTINQVRRTSTGAGVAVTVTNMYGTAFCISFVSVSGTPLVAQEGYDFNILAEAPL